MSFLRNIAPAYYLLIIPLLRLSAPFFLYRLKYYMVVPFMVLWWVWSFSAGRRTRDVAYVRAVRAFVAFVVVYALYQLLPFLYTFLGYGNANALGLYTKSVSLFYIVFWGYVINWSLKNRKIDELKFLLCLAAFGVIYTGLNGVISYDKFEDTGGARALTGIGAAVNVIEQYEIINDLREYGQGNYTYLYTLSFVVGILVYWFLIAKSVVARIALLFVFGAIGVSIRNGGLATPLFVIVISLMSLAAYYVFGKKRKAILLFSSTAAVLLLTYAYNPRMFSFLAPPIRLIGETIESEQYSMRLNSLADSLSGNWTTYAYERYQLQKRSFDTFCESGNYLFGCGAYTENRKSMGYGGHSTICDTLAMFGILGFTLWLWFYLLFIKWFNCMADAFFDTKARVVPLLFVGSCLFASMANPVRDIHELSILVVFGVAAFIPNTLVSCRK